MEDKKKYDFSVVDYQYTNVPQYRENQNEDWVTLGEDNLYPYFLQDLLTGSSMHNAIVRGCTDMIYGKGLDAHNKDEHVEQWLKVSKLFGDGEALKRVAFDYKLYGNAYLNIIWSTDRTHIAELHHVPSAYIRAGKADDTDKIPLYYHSTDWASVGNGVYVNGQEVSQPYVIPAFSSTDRTAASQILHIKQYNPISFFYGISDWIGGVRWVDLDRQIAEFHSSNLQSGLFPSMVISLNNGVPTDDERRRIEQLIYEKFSGAQNAGKFLMFFNDSAADAPTIEAFQPTDPQKTYQFFSDEIALRILQANRVTSPILFGLRGDGGLGNNADELRDSWDLFYHSVISPMQDTILKCIHPLLSVNGITLDVFFKKLQPASFLDLENEKETVKNARENVSETEQAFSSVKKKESDLKSRLRLLDSRLSDNHFLVRSEIVDGGDIDELLHRKKHKFYEEYANKEDISDFGDIIGRDGYLFTVRYMYAETAMTPPVNPNYESRDFCIDMMDLSDDGVMFRYEDIEDMYGENEEFFHKGTSGFDKFTLKGGIYCRHGWKRQIFIYAPEGEPLEVEMMDIEGAWDDVMRKVGNNPDIVQKGEEYVAPIDTASRGAYD